MAVPTKVVLDCETKAVSEIPLNDEEMAQLAIDQANAAAAQAEREAADKAKADAKASALTKLTALGLNADEIAALN